jgi:predicted HicB family RNase H-like nuclease
VVRLGLRNGKNRSRCWADEGRGDEMKKKETSCREFEPKELREYRKWFQISRIQYLNKICSNSNEFYSKFNSRSHINTRINASRHECNNQL